MTKSIPRDFDALIALPGPLDSAAVVDSGASSFVALSHYLISNQVPACWRTWDMN
jgi:hypothetical protein